ncbi:FtsX-like permease family protein, partial [Candidatus Woesearchaeota archaeon]|nr:FtsX-like permease family protein [Candidatus Woesearchaeota archaeon]
FTVSTTDDYMETFGIVLTVVQIVLIGIAAISLLVGGVNIANTMYTSVLERTNEVGIMKAIGARNSDVFLLFLIESGILGVVGGIAGIAVGIGLSKLVAFVAASAGWTFIQTLFPWYLTIGALLFSFAVGAISGTLPAYQASKLKPVDALRYE